MQHRAYPLEIRATDEDKRIIEGVANTGDIDSYNTILEPEGAIFKLPMPVLYQHNSRQPIGHVIEAKTSKNAIRVRIQIAKAGVAGFIDEAWSLIKARLVGGLSVGFDADPEGIVYDKSFDGHRIQKWHWYELSTVTLPANQSATMSSVRSADEAILAASGKRERTTAVRLNPPASGPSRERPPMKNLKEHIANLRSKWDANDSRINAIIEKAADESRSRDAAELEECENLETENVALKRDIEDFERRQKTLVVTAAPIEPTGPALPGREPEQRGIEQRRAAPITVRSATPAHISMARMAISMWHARNNHRAAAELCTKHWPDQPELALTLRAIVEAADTTTSGWASQLVPAAQQLQEEFLDMYRAQTILGRIPGLRNVPFNVAVPLRTGAGTFQWVGEAAPKPVTSETFDRISLLWHKAAAITVITQELARFSSPAAEAVISQSMRDTIVRFLDLHFVSSTAEVSGVSPAGILNGITPVTPTGTTAATFKTDMFNMLNNFTANGVPLDGIVLLMSETQALALSMMATDLGVFLYPTVSAAGGTVFGRPIIISEAVGTKIIAIKASDILFASDPGATITVSDQATLEMETTPAVGEQSPPSTQSVLKSMFQNNMLAIRCEQFITWKRARTAAVEYINGNAYVPS